jgi:hypothetical protein
MNFFAILQIILKLLLTLEDVSFVFLISLHFLYQPRIGTVFKHL